MLPSSAPNVPNASAENSVPLTASYVIITSGQCTHGASMKLSSCLPSSTVSPSSTVMQRAFSAAEKNWPMNLAASGEHSTLACG